MDDYNSHLAGFSLAPDVGKTTAPAQSEEI
jgi:hypothetical protein